MGRRQVIFEGRIPESWAGHSLQDFLRDFLNLSNRQRQRIVRTKGLTIDGRNAHSNTKAKLDQTIKVTLPQDEQVRLEPKAFELEILIENEHLLVINKPAGLLVHPVGNLKDLSAAAGAAYYLSERHRRQITPRPVHRLDRDASGILVFALTAAVQEALTLCWNTETIIKEYQAVIWGTLSEETLLNEPIHGKPAETLIEPISSHNGYTVVQCSLHSGRHHQIRRHLANAGFPILGDQRYGASGSRKAADRLCLHKQRFIIGTDSFLGPLTVSCSAPDWNTLIRKELLR